MKAQENKKTTINVAWVTFDTMDMKKRAEAYYFKTFLKIFAMNFIYCCCVNKKKHYIKNRMAKCNEAPEPDNIRWENFGQSALQKSIRQSISAIITVIFLGLACYFIIYIRSIQRGILSKNPKVDCNTPYYDSLSLTPAAYLTEVETDYANSALTG